ncbi:conserved hypothetical protein containing TrkA-C domain [Halorhabdus tiamatea SARL4B]|uniref:RCK C-terminal domain-containing protein n=1 Tax=Halorhabdus tiamatea SARL4B TaxID=1033806 RepID=S6CSS0_9EURY|nr:conserved hypothetical protein containing TrkA-C domain [Halorhabdus tiamatea SARL4B]
MSLVGLVVLSTLTAAFAAVCYRRETTRPIPTGAAVLTGLVSISLWIGGRIVSEHTVVADLSLVLDATGYFLIGSFGAGAVGAFGGRRLGDAIACVFADIQPAEHPREIADVRRSARQARRVQLPETILDRSGSDPVDRELKRELAGSTWSLPRTLSPEAVTARVKSRFERDYGIDRVEIEMDGPHILRRLAIGYEPSGLSASLPPRTVGVAVESQRTSGANVGDPVDVWTAEDDRVAFAGRATVERASTNTTTLVLPAARSTALVGTSPDGLTTIPAAPDDGADFRSVLRASDHAISVLTVEANGPLEGEFVGWLAVTVLVIVRDEGVISLPAETETLRSGDDVYVFGGPSAFEALARFERARRSDAPA